MLKRIGFLALLAYEVVAWTFAEVADMTFGQRLIPETSMTVLIVLVVIGFPIVAIEAGRGSRCRTMNGLRGLFPTRTHDDCT